MATTTGNNPATGDSSATTQAKAEQQAAIAVDKQLRAAIRESVDVLAKAAGLAKIAKETNVWQIMGDKSWELYFARVCAEETGDLGAGTRDALIRLALDEGLSLRQAAKAANTSLGTVQRAQAKDGAKDAKDDNGGPGTRKDDDKAKAKRRVKSFETVVSNLVESLDHIELAELNVVMAKLGMITPRVKDRIATIHAQAEAQARAKHPAGKARGRQQAPGQQELAA